MKKSIVHHKNILIEFSKTIDNSEFKNFFSKFKLNQALQQHVIKDGYHNLYIVGYESNQCKLGFFHEVGNTFYVAIAYSETDLWDEYEWIGLEYLMAYLKKEPLIRGFDRPFEERNNIKNRLNEVYRNFQPFSTQIFSLFQDEKQVSNLRLALKEYIEEDTHRRYSLK